MGAAFASLPGVLRVLLVAQADPKARNSIGQTPLHVACNASRVNSAELLLDNGAEIDEQDYFGCTPFLFACGSGRGEMAKYLLHRGASVQATTVHSWNALHCAATCTNNSALVA